MIKSFPLRFSIVLTIVIFLLISLMSKIQEPQEFLQLLVKKGPIALLGGLISGFIFSFSKKKE